MKLKIADGLSLPLEVVTQTIAILAKRRAGKSAITKLPHKRGTVGANRTSRYADAQ